MAQTASSAASSNLVAWWQFDEDSGTTASDSSGDGYNATLVNGVSWVSGEIGSAVSANGTNQYARSPSIDLTGTQAVTWAAWVKRTYGSGTGALIEDTPDFNSYTTGFGFFPDDGADCGTTSAMMTGVGGNVGYTINCYAQPTSGVWHHLAVIYDKSKSGTSVITLYLDGVLQTPIKQPYTATNTNNFGNNPVFLFSRGGASNFAGGQLDDLRLYNQALTAAQIQQIYQQGLGSLLSIAVSPANGSLAMGASVQYSATGTYSDGSQHALTSGVTWSSSSAAVATIASSGLATGVAPGSTTIQATSGSVSGSTSLSVTAAPTLQSISVTPASFSIQVGRTQQLTATGTYSDGSTQNLSSAVTWSSSTPSVATVNSSGLVSAVASGTATIQATYNAISGSAQGTVVAASLNLSGWWQFDEGSGTTASDSSGNGYAATLINGITWVTGQIGDAISANGTNQYARIPNIDESATNAITWAAWVKRTYGSGTGALIENTPDFNSYTTGFGFFPDDGADCGTTSAMMTGVGGNVGYTINCYAQPTSGVWHHIAVIYDKSKSGTSAISLYLDGVLQTPIKQPYTATNTNNFGNNATYLFSRGGISNYSAGLLDDLRLYNQALTAAQIQQIYQQGMGTLQSLTVTPSTASVNQALTEQYTATGTYANGAQHVLTADVIWSSSNTAVAAINSSGLATAIAAGTTTIQAVSGAISATASLTVTAATLQSITVTPVNQIITRGGTQQYTALGTYSDGSTQNLSTSVAWSSSNGSVATINATGLAAGVAAGNSTISATAGSVAGSTNLTVTTPGATLQSIAITPYDFAIALGATQQLTATGTYSDGSTANLSNAVTWTSSNPVTATVSASGLLTAGSSGTVTITVTYSGIGASDMVVVSPAIGQFVQWSSGDGGSVASTVIYQDQNATTGDTILVFSHWAGQSVTSTVTDQMGNTYTPIFPPTNVGTVDRFQVWYAKNITGGAPLIIRVAYSGTTAGISVTDVIEYAGLDITTPLDVYTSATGSGMAQSSGNMPTTTAANETIIGLFGYSGYRAPYVAGPGFTFRNYDASTLLEDMTVGSTGVYSASASSSSSSDWAAFAMAFKNQLPVPPGLTLSPSSIRSGNSATATVVLNSAAPAGGALVTLSSSQPTIVSVPVSITIPAGSTSGSFTVTAGSVTFTATVSIYAKYGSTQTATLTVLPVTMAQVASDTFSRPDAASLGSSWTPLIGATTNVPLQIMGGQIVAASGTSVAKELYYGGLNWTPDQYSQVQIVAAAGGGNEGPAVRMSSNDTHYACVVYNLGTGSSSVAIVLDNASNYITLASSNTATVTAGDMVRCTAEGATLTMSDITSSTTLLTATDATIPSGYPGLIDRSGGAPSNYIMANWSGGSNAAPPTAVQIASDDFNRSDALSLGSEWVIGAGHGPIQIVSDQIEPYPSGGPQPSKQHYIGSGPFPNDQWSQVRVAFEDTIGDVAAEVRASDSTDNMYVCDVNLTGVQGTAETRIVKV